MQRVTDTNPDQQALALEKAKMSIIFNYERITGQNLYGYFPDRSIWNSLNYQKAAATAIRNAEQFGRTLIAETIKKHLLK